MRAFAALLFGGLFGLGLLISGMLDPDKVLGFLDIAGDWNPQLAFVMGGAIAAATPFFVIARRRERTLLGDPLVLPERLTLDWRLVAGAAIFGVGWGLSGLCPGPAVVLLGFAGPPAWIFGAAVIAGLVLGRLLLSGSGAARRG
ncbi:MAG: YeeE/YedE family protein [Caulobacter sp.]|nr:YeeE/YedE family protein [Caulobacter sp.]